MNPPPVPSDPALSRRQFLQAAAAGAVGLPLTGLLGPAYAAGRDKTNLVLIMADDLGYECLGANGNVSCKTPHLDRLAAAGVRFRHCHAQPLCTPSRVKIMTGRSNARNYVRFGVLDPKETTFAHVLRKAGYATCIVGKWQLGGGLKGPNRAGFDEYCLWQIAKHNRGKRYWNPTLTINGRRHETMKGTYGPDVCCDALLDFIARHKDGPFLAYFPMCLTHNPFVRTPDSPAGRAGKQEYFADMVAYTDKLVGRIVATLDKLGLRENTLLLFTGDNGTHTGIRTQTKDGPVRGGKGTTLDTGTHVPLVASWPGTAPRAAVSDALIDFADFLPTFAEAAGATLPDDLSLDGQSFLPILRGKDAPRRDGLFCHYEPRHGGRFGRHRWARDRRWKLYDGGRLFDVAADPRERKPFLREADPPAAAAARRRLQAVLDRAPKAPRG
jgi:arylsulfatase A